VGVTAAASSGAASMQQPQPQLSQSAGAKKGPPLYPWLPLVARLCCALALVGMFCIDKVLREGKQAASAAEASRGYDAGGAVWNKRLSELVDFAPPLRALREAGITRCDDATPLTLVVGHGGVGGNGSADAEGASLSEAAAAAAVRRVELCGWAVLGPGLLLPRLGPAVLQEMAAFGNELLDQGWVPGGGGAWAASELLPPPHSDRRGDTWPPFGGGGSGPSSSSSSSSPFGVRMLEGLADGLGPLLQQLLGEDAALDFVSVLYARPGTRKGCYPHTPTRARAQARIFIYAFFPSSLTQHPACCPAPE
jgi:hypothetical protein